MNIRNRSEARRRLSALRSSSSSSHAVDRSEASPSAVRPYLHGRDVLDPPSYRRVARARCPTGASIMTSSTSDAVRNGWQQHAAADVSLSGAAATPARRSRREMWLPIAKALCSPRSSSWRSSASSAPRSRNASASRPRRSASIPMPILLRDQPGYRIGNPQRRPRRRSRFNSTCRRDDRSAISAPSSTRATRAQGAKTHDANAVHAGERLCLPGLADEELAQRCTRPATAMASACR